jgi:hypothetical protein
MRASVQPQLGMDKWKGHTIMIKKYGAVPPLQTIFIDPHSVKSEFSTSKLNPKAAGRIARTSEDNNSIVEVFEVCCEQSQQSCWVCRIDCKESCVSKLLSP